MNRANNFRNWLLLSLLLHSAAAGATAIWLSGQPDISFENAVTAMEIQVVPYVEEIEILPPEPQEQVITTEDLRAEPLFREQSEPRTKLTEPPPPPVPAPSKPRTPPAPRDEPRPTPRQDSSGTNTPTAAQVLRSPVPPYPAAARRAGHQSDVMMRVRIGTDGRVVDATITRGSGRRDMDQAALNTVKNQWRFRPATRLGIPVESSETIHVTFVLR